MGILDKIPFIGKKHDDLGGFDDFGKDSGLGNDFGGQGGLGDPSGFSGSGGFGQQGGFGPHSQGSQGLPGMDSGPDNFSGMGQGQQGFPQPSSGFNDLSSQPPGYQAPGQPSFQSQQSFSPSSSGHDDYINSKSLEVISSKIDALRAVVESMNQRLANLERIAGQEEENRRRRYY